MKKKNLWKLLFSLLIMVTTIGLLYLTNFLDLKTSGTIGLKLTAQIVIVALGFFWMLTLAPQPLRQNIYFASGTVMIIVSLYCLAPSQLDFPRIELLTEIDVFEALTIMFSGIFFMMYGWFTKPWLSPA